MGFLRFFINDIYGEGPFIGLLPIPVPFLGPGQSSVAWVLKYLFCDEKLLSRYFKISPKIFTKYLKPRYIDRFFLVSYKGLEQFCYPGAPGGGGGRSSSRKREENTPLERGPRWCWRPGWRTRGLCMYRMRSLEEQFTRTLQKTTL